MISLAVCCGYVGGVWCGSGGEAEANLGYFHGVKCLLINYYYYYMRSKMIFSTTPSLVLVFWLV